MPCSWRTGTSSRSWPSCARRRPCTGRPRTFREPAACRSCRPVALEEELRSAVERAFETEWAAPLEQAGTRHRRLFVEGRPADVLLDVAEREDVGLIVTGRRGRTGLVSVLAGSVSQELIHRARIPVTVVPDGEDRG